MDFPNLSKVYYNGIRFKLSELFFDEGYANYTIKDNALTKGIYDLRLHFSVENFSKAEADAIKFTFSDDTELLDAVHDNYVFRREESLAEFFTSIKKNVPKKVGFNGVIQTIEGKNYEEEPSTMYFMATIEIDNIYYVFQMIGKKENMAYLYDDFIELLNSIEK